MGGELLERARGCALGAAIGDAFGMPLEFHARQRSDSLARDMQDGRLRAGAFTDDTEMALALADSLLASPERHLDADDLAQRFVTWLVSGPDDVGRHTRLAVGRIAVGQHWRQAAEAVQHAYPDSAGNGSVMRCWPVALACWDDLDRLLAESDLQSRVTHVHPECVAACQFINATIYHLLRGASRQQAVQQALANASLPAALRETIVAAPGRSRDQLNNSGWVRDTVESAVWGLLTTDSFEEAVIQVANLGGDADTAAAVVGALAGAHYGAGAVPDRWRATLQGEWPLRTGVRWDAAAFVALADRLVGA